MSELKQPALFAPIEHDLQAVEDRLLAATRSDIGRVRDVSGHTLLSGGKRLRPALALLAARLVGRTFPAERAYAAAAAAEMIHMASLMHDDVVDGATERRNKPTASSVFGNGITVLTGDFLLAKAISLLAHNDENLSIVRVFSDVTVGMAEGEVLQASVAHDLTISSDTYEEVIRRKTAYFLAGCTETGAMVGGGTPDEIAALRDYGTSLGVAFQIADDLLDFLGDPKTTGKPLGTDLKDGRVTLPLIHTLAVCDADTRANVTTLFQTPDMTDTEIATITGIIARHGGFEHARTVAEAHADKAVTCLQAFTPTPFKETLAVLARFVTARDR